MHCGPSGVDTTLHCPLLQLLTPPSVPDCLSAELYMLEFTRLLPHWTGLRRRQPTSTHCCAYHTPAHKNASMQTDTGAIIWCFYTAASLALAICEQEKAFVQDDCLPTYSECKVVQKHSRACALTPRCFLI